MAGLSVLTPESELDRKLRVTAERKAAQIAAGPTGQPLKLDREALLKRFAELTPTPPDGVVGSIASIARIPIEEGDPLPVSHDLRGAVVPDRFESATLDSYQPMTDSQAAALRAVRGWVDRTRKGSGAMLALLGPTGCGKSHLLYAAANALLDGGLKPYARPWYRLADELRYGGESAFVRGRKLEAHEIRTQLWGDKIVLLDEIRPTASTAFDDTELAKYACHAYDRRVAVLITTNVNPLADVMGPPAASRFVQVVIDGPDWRQR